MDDLVHLMALGDRLEYLGVGNVPLLEHNLVDRGSQMVPQRVVRLHEVERDDPSAAPRQPPQHETGTQPFPPVSSVVNSRVLPIMYRDRYRVHYADMETGIRHTNDDLDRTKTGHGSVLDAHRTRLGGHRRGGSRRRVTDHGGIARAMTA
ncbi:MAG: hypothetical protein R2849_12290 [Thermomicrobiales bacterium]